MWKITVRSPEGSPRVYDLKPGINTVGRTDTSAVYIEDVSASRLHAELVFDQDADSLVINDLKSKNGTYVNGQRISEPVGLRAKDAIRIGQCVISLTHLYTGRVVEQPKAGSHRFTRELVLEALDHHAVLMYEVARELNTVIDVDTALNKVSSLMERFMGADKCAVILPNEFDRFHELGFPETIARSAIEKRSTVIVPDMATYADQEVGKSAMLYRVRSALCVPVMSGDEDVLALIYMYKTDPETRSFDENDMQLAVAISHQAALTLQRTSLLERVRADQEMQQLLRRFLSPQDAEALRQEYQQSDSLPGLSEQTITVMFVDLADSTGMAERLGAQRFGTLLESLYQDLTEIIFEYGGLIKLLGDGIMAIFSQDRSEVGPEESAVRAGIDIIAKVSEPGYLESAVDQSIVIGVGVNTGLAVAGYVGTRERVEFTVLGDTVNVAARMQDYARPNRLVVGPGTMAGVVGQFETERVGEVAVRGREKTLQIYEVLRPHTFT